MRKLFHVLCGVAAVLVTAPALAQESISDSGLYISIAAGGSDGSFVNTNWTDSAYDPGGSLNRTFVVDYHYGGLVALGYQWAGENSPADIRLEIEGGYRRSYLEAFVESDGTYFVADGYLETGSVMANGYVDFHLGEAVSPYLGAGFGAARLARRDLVIAGFPPISNKYTYSTAWQLMAGVGYKLSPGAVLGLEFRYMELQEFSFPEVIFSENISFEEILITFRLVG
jgi:opacity protein-like surface antigen